MGGMPNYFDKTTIFCRCLYNRKSAGTLPKNQLSAECMYIENNHGSDEVVISKVSDQILTDSKPLLFCQYQKFYSLQKAGRGIYQGFC